MKLTNFLLFHFSVTAERETCNLLQKGVAAIFGPQTPASAEHIRSITDVAEIPFIDTRWNYHPVNPVLTSNDRNAYTINLHPDVDTVGKSQGCIGYPTPARTHSISGLKSPVLKLSFLSFKMMVKNGLEFILNPFRDTC